MNAQRTTLPSFGNATTLGAFHVPPALLECSRDPSPAGRARGVQAAPGVAGALIATVTGLLVAIPAMFAYNFMVTTIRAITQELDGFATRYATQIEHVYVDNRDIEDKIAGAIQRAEENRKSAKPVAA